LADGFVGAKRIVSKLVVARHELHARKLAASASGMPLGFPVMTDGPLSASPATVALDPTAARIQPPSHWTWAAVVLGGLLLLVAGRLGVRRLRRQPLYPI
jgi:hypothetical protein